MYKKDHIYHFNNWVVCSKYGSKRVLFLKQISKASCQKGPTRHAYSWMIGPFWQDTLDMSDILWADVPAMYHDWCVFVVEGPHPSQLQNMQ